VDSRTLPVTVISKLSAVLTPQKECPANREVAPGKDGNAINEMFPETPSSTVLRNLQPTWAMPFHSAGASSMS